MREGPRVYTPVGERSMTKQAFQSETDVNVIMRKYQDTGVLESFNARPGRFGDVSSASDYRAALDKVMAAQAAFDSLPAKVRDYVQNDAGRLLDLVFDPAREGELRELGLLPPSEVAPAKAPEVS